MEPERARELLARERERVESALANLRDDVTANADDPDEVDIVEGGSRLHDEEVDFGLIEQLTNELEAIERAEQRLAEDAYGVSVDSGEPIPDARLELIPWAERTAEEQARFEGSG
jgi:DnaK suppressor protein